MAEKETNQENLERMGLAKVRLLVATDGLPPPLFGEARNWLAQKEDEERARNEAMQAEQMRVALSANRTAKIAAIAAIVAAIVAIIAAVISYLAWVYPVH